MSELYAPPALKLNRTETLDLLAAGQWPDGIDKWRVQSTWLCDRLNQYEECGYVYNAVAQRRVEKEEGLPPSSENGSMMSLLIYNAQRYRRSDALRAQGFAPLTVEMIKQALDENLLIEVHGQSLIGGDVRTACRPVQSGELYFCLLPKKRTKGYMANHGHIARLVDKKGITC